MAPKIGSILPARARNPIFRGSRLKTLGKGMRYAEVRKRLLALYGSKCARCGFSDPRALQFDHVNGDGHKSRYTYRNAKGQVVRSGTPTRYYDIASHPEKYQVLCANCNWIKRAEQGEDGHSRKLEGQN